MKFLLRSGVCCIDSNTPHVKFHLLYHQRTHPEYVHQSSYACRSTTDEMNQAVLWPFMFVSTFTMLNATGGNTLLFEPFGLIRETKGTRTSKVVRVPYVGLLWSSLCWRRNLPEEHHEERYGILTLKKISFSNEHGNFERNKEIRPTHNVIVNVCVFIDFHDLS